MQIKKHRSFELPDKVLTSLPTGAVKDTVEQLGRRIAHGEFKTGAIFPKEDELVDELGVSRTVVREAIKVLCGKGLIRTARRYGSRVSPFDNWNLLDPDVIRWHDPTGPLASRLYAEATELRLIFEPEAAALAAINANHEQRDTILAAAKSLHPEDDDPEWIGADYAFHATILEASGNLMLSQLESLIYAVLIFAYSAGRKSTPEEQIVRHDHIGVAEAIIAGNADLSRTRMRNMLLQNKLVSAKIAAAAATG
jgi:DNA-binding FadR family transcriptional regulator